MLKAEKEKRVKALEKRLSLNSEKANMTEAELDEEILILDEIIYNSEGEKEAEEQAAIKRIVIKHLKKLSENELEKIITDRK